MTDTLLIGILGSIIATVVVLLTQTAFYKIRDRLPARALFNGIAGSGAPCLVFIPRMTDVQQEGQFLEPLPRYAVVTNQSQFGTRQHIPWVNSIAVTQSVAHVLNVLGLAGRTENIQIAFVDEDFDQWESPMFILGGGWKATRAFENCHPHFAFQGNSFVLRPTGERFSPCSHEHDIGLLQKMINPATGLPVWIAMGGRGAGTNAATCALNRWWKKLGAVYGSKPFGVLLEMNDRDGWQQARIISVHPQPAWHRKLRHPYAWRALCQAQLPGPLSSIEKTTEQRAAADS